MIPLKHIGLLVVIFAATVAIRWPHVARPLSKHHEFCTATTLRVLTVWHQEGIASKGYNPATNFEGEANKHINNHASGSGTMVDAAGNYYYVSHPPLAYYLPYALFGILGSEPDVLPLQCFNLFINLLCGLGIYLLARQLLPGHGWVGPLAALIYWFIPATLWFQGNVYMSDMLVQLFFVWALVWALRLLQGAGWGSVVALGVTCFLATYTTWFGVLMAVVLVGYFGWKRKQTPLALALVAVVALSQVFALGLMVWQYSQIAGWDAYSAELAQRFGTRGLHGLNVFTNLLPIAFNYAANYGLLLLVGLVLAFYWRKSPVAALKPLFILGLLPILLLHVLLPNYSGHDFTTLYLAVPLSVWLAVQATLLGKKWLWGLLGVAIVSGPLLYALANPYGKFARNGDPYITEFIEARRMMQEPTEAVLFVIGAQPPPQALWYAKRNIMQVANEGEALAFMSQRSINKGVMFERPRGGAFKMTKTLSLPD